MAAFTRDFTFDQLSRIGEDSCGLSQKNVQNVSASNYLLTNFFSLFYLVCFSFSCLIIIINTNLQQNE